MKILLLDIETSLMSASTFHLYPKYIPHTAIIKDWHIICWAAKWLNSDTIYSGKCDKDFDDKKCTQKLRDMVAKADVVVGHNSDKFDLKKLNTRCIKHGINPFPKPVSIDTLKSARKEFGFTSNRLDYLGKYLGVGGKLETTPFLWDRVLAGDYKAVGEMLEYNKRDVTLLEDVYLKMRPYIRNHPNHNVWRDLDHCCPNCGSVDISKWGFYRTQAGRYQRYVCESCGAWSRGKKNLANTIEVR